MTYQEIREPPRWWTVPVPFLLTLPVSAWAALLTAFAGLLGCFDTWTPKCALATAFGAAELIVAAVSVVALIAGLAVPTWRRALRRVLWIGCALAWLGAAYMYAWASRPH